jgi:hypothetical protein
VGSAAVGIISVRFECPQLARVGGWLLAGIALMQSSTNQGFAIISGGSKSQATLA